MTATTATLAAAARTAALANLLARAKAGEALKPTEIDRLEALAAGDARITWPTRSAAALALGLTPARLRGYERHGCPSSAKPIEQLPLLLWLWQHRALVTSRERRDAHDEDRLRAERLRLGNQRLVKAHTTAAAAIVLRILERARGGLRRAMTPAAIATLRTAPDEPALVAAICDLVDRVLGAAAEGAKA